MCHSEYHNAVPPSHSVQIHTRISLAISHHLHIRTILVLRSASIISCLSHCLCSQLMMHPFPQNLCYLELPLRLPVLSPQQLSCNICHFSWRGLTSSSICDSILFGAVALCTNMIWVDKVVASNSISVVHTRAASDSHTHPHRYLRLPQCFGWWPQRRSCKMRQLPFTRCEETLPYLERCVLQAYRNVPQR